jgi:hypothetical protein
MVVIDDVEGSKRALQECLDAGATDVLCQFQVGGLEHEKVVRSIELFARKVAALNGADTASS